MSDYKNFYENIDRDQVYSANKDAERHPVGELLRKTIQEYNLKDKKALEIGSGNGRFQNIINDYTGIDISENAAKYYTKPYFVVRDKEAYPFSSASFDFVFTNVVFEHIPDINFALRELDRVLRPGGILFFKSGWNCRPWAAEGYQVRPYSDFDVWGKLYKFFVPVRNNFFYRAICIAIKRTIFIVLFLLDEKLFKDKLFFRKLKPNYTKFWQSDSDACNDIDPFLAVLYFRANGYQVLNYSSLISQFMIKHGEILFKKKDV